MYTPVTKFHSVIVLSDQGAVLHSIPTAMSETDGAASQLEYIGDKCAPIADDPRADDSRPLDM